MKIMSLLVIMASFAAQADDSKISYKDITTDGQRSVVAVGSCSIPSLNGYSAYSTGSYTVCQEKITNQYKVTGSGWNSSKEIVPGTSRRSFVLQQLDVQGSSSYSSGGQTQQEQINDAITSSMAMLSAQSQCINQLQQLRALQVHVSRTACAN